MAVVYTKKILVLNEKVFVRKIVDRVVDGRNGWWFTFKEAPKGQKVFQVQVLDLADNTLFFFEYTRKSAYAYKKHPFWVTVYYNTGTDPYIRDSLHRFAAYMKWYWYIKKARLPETVSRVIEATLIRRHV